MASVTAISNTILSKSFSESIPVTPMKLQKLLYFVYRDYLKYFGEPIFSERFLTWQHGPVLRSAYDEFKSFGARPITRFAKDANNNVYVLSRTGAPTLSGVLDRTWENYKMYDGIYLSKLTHLPGTAWSEAAKKGLPCLLDEDIINEEVES